MLSSDTWVTVAAICGVPGVLLLVIAAIATTFSKSTADLSDKRRFILHNRMLFVFGGLILVVAALSCSARAFSSKGASGDCQAGANTSLGDKSPNAPCNSGTVSIK